MKYFGQSKNQSIIWYVWAYMSVNLSIKFYYVESHKIILTILSPLKFYRHIERYIGSNKANDWYIFTLPKILYRKTILFFAISFHKLPKKWFKVSTKMTIFFNKSKLTDFTHIYLLHIYIVKLLILLAVPSSSQARVDHQDDSNQGLNLDDFGVDNIVLAK